MNKDIAWVDTANQIGNSWYKKTAVGVFFEKSGKFCGIEISSKYKLKIKDKLRNYRESEVIGNLQSYLVYLCFLKVESIPLLEKTYLCSDFQPIRSYHKYLQKCFSYHGKQELFNNLKIRCKPKEIKSKAHPKVRKLYRKRRGDPDYLFNKSDVVSFINYFQKQNIKKVEGLR